MTHYTSPRAGAFYWIKIGAFSSNIKRKEEADPQPEYYDPSPADVIEEKYQKLLRDYGIN